MKKMKKKTLIGTTIALAGLCSGLGVATYAGFSATVLETQNVGAAGTMKTSIFLNPNLWDVLGTEVYYFHAWLNADNTKSVDLLPTRSVTVEVFNKAGNDSTVFNMVVFELDRNTYRFDRFDFFRCNPDGITQENFATENKWNQTGDIEYSADVNYYCIDGWTGGGNGSDSHHHYNKIEINGSGNLQFVTY